MDLADHRLLVIDDNPSIHEDFRKILLPNDNDEALELAESAIFGSAARASVRLKFALDCVDQGETGIHAVEQSLVLNRPYSVVFTDMRMPPGLDGVETIQQLWKIDPSLQVVITSAYSDHSWEEIRRRLGASDQLFILRKPFDNIEVLQFAHALCTRWDAARQIRQRLAEAERSSERRTAELRQSEERFAAAFRAAPIPQAILNFTNGQIVEANAAFCELTGFPREDLTQHSVATLTHTGLLGQLRKPHPLKDSECTVRSRDGEEKKVQLSTQPTQLADQPHLILMLRDFTDTTRLENQLRHGQKMEAMGQLAAGVAHDFNNILTVIQGNLSLQLATAELAPAVAASLHQTLAFSEQAAGLTRQLLAFSRKELFTPEPLDLNELVRTQSSLLSRLIGEHIAVEWECAEKLPGIIGDGPSVAQVMTNLIIHARDSMPKGGKLRISTGVIDVSPATAAQNPEAREGRFVRFSVVDTGAGMDTATLSRLFDPASSDNQGHHLGLATAYGIVKQHEGWIEVFSDPGRGTAFFVYLPASDRPVKLETALTPMVQGQTALNVLLVEDEPAVRTILTQLLTHCGCQVIQAGDAREAYTLWSQHKQYIHLLVTDIVMPGGATGHDLANQLLIEKPDLKVIYSSGYNPDLYASSSELVAGRNFLPKPYDAASVLKMIRRVAAEPAETGLAS